MVNAVLTIVINRKLLTSPGVTMLWKSQKGLSDRARLLRGQTLKRPDHERRLRIDDEAAYA